MAFIVRRGKREDAASIALVHVESWKSTYRGIVPESYLAALDTDSRIAMWKEQLVSDDTSIFVAEDESAIVGFAAGGRLRESVDGYTSDDAELYAIYLLSARQRQGVGRMLTRTLADSLRVRGFRGLLVWVLEQNPSVGFYKRLGGMPVAEKSIEIGGALLPEVAIGWPSIDRFVTGLDAE